MTSAASRFSAGDPADEGFLGLGPGGIKDLPRPTHRVVGRGSQRSSQALRERSEIQCQTRVMTFDRQDNLGYVRLSDSSGNSGEAGRRWW